MLSKFANGGKGMHIPLLQLNLASICPGLRGNELLQVAHSVIWAALDSDCRIKGV